MVLVRVPENQEYEMLKEFFENSCFTFEGVEIKDKEGIQELDKLLRTTGFNGSDLIGYFFTGNVMNRMYGLTDDNAYKDDLTFLVIPDYYNPIVKLRLGARWFDDIVRNNYEKQRIVDRKNEE